MTAAPRPSDFIAFAEACERELDAIIAWWARNAVDPAGGFYGEIDAENRPAAGAAKGVILNTRILWFFSAAASAQPTARALAQRAYDYVRQHFVDPAHGGVVWELDAQGRVINDKKQAYAQAFAIYALSAFYRATGDAGALALARDIFALTQRHFLDPERGGYIEARDAAWRPLDDVRLSAFDANCPKTMNTHLHVLEAFTGLNAAAPSAETTAALRGALELMTQRFADRARGTLRLFFTMDWQDRSESVSFGHDIEASWLIWQACEALGDSALAADIEPLVIALARAALHEGQGPDGGLYSERALASGEIDRARVWWAQAEALVGFLNAYALSGDSAFFAAARRAWDFIQRHHLDHARGEWTWWSSLDTPRADRAYKVGFWKGPYHNGRAMLEMSQRLRRLAQRA